VSAPARQSIVLVDTNAINAAHRIGCWNALRKNYQLHSVRLCVEEATRPNRHGRKLVDRPKAELAAELVLGKVDDLARAELRLAIGNRNDVDAGEAELLAYARTLPGRVWWLCGPDAGTVKAMNHLRLLDRMVALESLAKVCGHATAGLPDNYTERWLSAQRTKLLLAGL
jgi:hypothetical protein